MAAASLPTLPFHSLRHSAATILLVQGVHPRVVMEVLGHSDVRLTLGTYSHVVAQLPGRSGEPDGRGTLDGVAVVCQFVCQTWIRAVIDHCKLLKIMGPANDSNR